MTLRVDADTDLPAPAPLSSRQFVVRVPGRAAPLEAMVVSPLIRTDRLLLYFLGFNNPLGPWEGTKAALLAEAFGVTVVTVELPGQSRFGDPIPAPVRRSMLRGQVSEWAALHRDYLEVAVAAAGLSPVSVDLLGYSTGCSLAVAALPSMQDVAPVRSITLVEPVAASRRGLPALARDNAFDVRRQPPSFRTNHRHRWVMELRRRQLREPWVRYWPQDLLAVTTLLRQDDLSGGLAAFPGRVNLVRGSVSDLCAPAAFEALDRLAGDGLTVMVDGLGHPLWHSFPVLVPLARLLGDSAAAAPATTVSGPG